MENVGKPLRLDKAAVYLQITILSGFILYWCKSVLIPVSFALLIAFLLYPTCRWMEKKGIPRGLSIGIALLLLVLLLSMVVTLLGSQFIRFTSEWPVLKSKVIEAVASLQEYISQETGITKSEQDAWIGGTLDSEKGQTLSIIKDFAYGTVVNMVLLILIPILSGLILYSRERWVNVLYHLLPNIEKERIVEVLKETITAYFNFIKGMGIVYLTVGILNSAGLALLGIPHPILFGFIASVLTFIPFVGIIVASLLPITISWITYDSVWYPLGVIGIFTLVQYLEANVIFPLAVSNRLSINPFITIAVILIGGLLWGAAGMILFIPYIAILKLVSDRSERLKPLSVLLGAGKTF